VITAFPSAHLTPSTPPDQPKRRKIELGGEDSNSSSTLTADAVVCQTGCSGSVLPPGRCTASWPRDGPSEAFCDRVVTTQTSEVVPDGGARDDQLNDSDVGGPSPIGLGGPLGYLLGGT
jgi:hypothetical protein